MFRKGTRLLAVASLLLIIEAIAHTLGTIGPLPDDPQLQAVVSAMQGFGLPLGLGMEPTLWDIQRALAFTMSVLLVLMGAIGLFVPALAPADRRLHRFIVALLLATNVALLCLWWSYRIPPPLLFQAVIALVLLAALLAPAARNDVPA